jgi:hypothetical protein
MSSASLDSESSQSSSGYEDGLGRRILAFDRETGEMLERLVLRPELSAFEAALKKRITIVAELEDERFARPRTIERDAHDRLTVVSEFVAGRRLSDALDAAAEHGIVAGLDAGLGLLLELLPALARLHDAGLAHGALAPGRVMITPAGQLVLLDSIYADPLERLKLTRRRLWSELRLVFPASAGVVRFDASADLGHAAMIAVALSIGRPLRDDDYPDGLPALRQEIVEIASIRGSKAFATGVDKVFAGALPIAGKKVAVSADEAAIDLRKLVRKELGITTCRNALLEFFQQVEAAEAERIASEGQRAGVLAAQQAAEATRLEAERAEAERLARERAEAERIEHERAEAERIERERAEQARIEQERLERERAETARAKTERLERERVAAEEARLEAERIERERVAAEEARLEAERIERERVAAEKARLKAERIERERIAAEQARLEAERIERERIAAEQARLEAERLERERIAAEQARLEADRIERERIAAEQARLEAERIERERIAAEQARLEAERIERERIAAEQARLEAERIERERIAAEQARLEAERLEQERAEKARLEAERIERERIAAEQARLEAERLERERIAAEQARLEAERLERERAEKARLEAERIERERIAAEKARVEAERAERIERERIAAEKARLEAERLERERAEKARLEAERIERERVAAEKARIEAERLERERLETERRERVAKERAEKARREAERAEKARLEAERLAEERAAAERRERELLEAARAERERAEKARAEAERLEQERAEQARLEAEREEQEEERERAERARVEAERVAIEERDRARERDRERERNEAAARAIASDDSRAKQKKDEPEVPAAAAGWLIPPDRAAKFDQPIAEAPPPAAPAAAAGWLVPPDRASKFDQPIAEAPPPAPTARLYPIYVPPAEPESWTPDIPLSESAPKQEAVADVSHGLAAPPPPATPAVPASKTGPIKLKEGGSGSGSVVSSRTASERHEPESISAEGAYEPKGTQKAAQPIPWKLLAAGVVLIAATTAIRFGYTPSDVPIMKVVRNVAPDPAGKPAPPPPVSGTAGRLTITTQPPGARVSIDGKAAGETPLTIDSVKPGRHVITLVTASGTSAKRTVRVEAGRTLAIDVPLFAGFANISAPFVIEISENGKALGTSDEQIILSPGSHTLRLANKQLGYVATETVEVQPGEVTRIAVDPRGRANINAAPWAEVWIDGEKAGETPLANVAVRLGIREFIFKNPQFGERKVVVTVTAGAPVSVSVDFNK